MIRISRAKLHLILPATGVAADGYSHMTGPDTALFGFRVGGVQEFIDSARTTEDFWASSYLISHLTQQAAEVVTAELGADCLIFPSAQAFGRAAAGPDGPQTEADLRIAQFPNGILAEVPRARAANGLGLEIEERFHGAWRSTMDAVRSVLERTFALQSGEARAIWERQAGRRTFETFWAWTPWDRGGGEEYMVAYQRLSALLEARKLLRDFEAGGEGEPHTKCTQCGKLQALQNFDHFSEKDAKTFWEELAGQENYRVKFRFRRSERLCAVCATCRMASRSPAFGGAGVDLRRAQPSTSSIAVAPFLKAVFAECLDYLDILEELARNAKAVAGAAGLGLLEESPYRGLNLGNWEDYPYLSELQHLDGDWFFKSSYDNGHFTQVKPQAIVDEGLLRAARKSLETLYEVVKKGNESKGMTPSAYVALVKLDGDEVGEWIGGNRAGRADIAGHRALSAALGRIGAAARPIVEDVLMGRLIYSGGDD